MNRFLADLAALDRSALAERWLATFGCPAPRNSQVALLRKVLAWHAQIQADPQWQGNAGFARLMRSLRPPTVAPALRPGTRLIRQWKEVTHQVTVVPAGFEYEGTVHRSLSVIARLITGTNWSGPAFFGLRK